MLQEIFFNKKNNSPFKTFCCAAGDSTNVYGTDTMYIQTQNHMCTKVLTEPTILNARGSVVELINFIVSTCQALYVGVDDYVINVGFRSGVQIYTAVDACVVEEIKCVCLLLTDLFWAETQMKRDYKLKTVRFKPPKSKIIFLS